MTQNIQIGISSCLLGHKVRFDSGHKNNKFIANVLSDYFEFKPFCPEVEIGLGIPRETIHLVNIDNDIRCVGTKSEDLDVTDALSNIAEQQKPWHSELSGYILKKSSPSCGMERVKIYKKSTKHTAPSMDGIGLYAKRLMENFPNLPIEEEGRLEDPHLRENFIKRIFIYARWQELQAGEVSIGKLQSFHANHKYIFMSHNQNEGRELGKILAVKGKADEAMLKDISHTYLTAMMTLLKKVASRKNHVNTLMHIQGYIKDHIDKEDKAELGEVIKDYHQGLLPLIVPITLLRHHFRKHPNEYIDNSFYMKPHPSELMLLNRI
jgi:uncharacterized protein YbgA (DUF1722 family)/uncharacterized protein YbbK (DUF523 family)